MKFEMFVMTRVFVESDSPSQAKLDALTVAVPHPSPSGAAQIIDAKVFHVRALPDAAVATDLM
jgi:hypothetical protein